jgi:hydrogenase expression/formation protein HypE
MSPRKLDSLSCPTPRAAGDFILLAHGEGARLTRRLVREMMIEAYNNEWLRPMADAAVLPTIDGPVVMTTDSFVVSPLFFPGGDIGRLAVHGTVNDLAVCGAEPLYLSLGLIIEEGLAIDTLRRVIGSIADAARDCGVRVVTGDTKVVPRGAADQLFVNTTGIGRLRSGVDVGAHRVRPGDRVLVSGTIGDHGIAILAAREQFEFESDLKSDTAPLDRLVRELFDCGADVHFVRDATRGGVSAVLHELVEAAGVTVELDEAAIPLSAAVRGACELLGLDPLYVANEGKLVAIVEVGAADRALQCLRRNPLGQHAAIIGEVRAGTSQVHVRGALGAVRVLDEPSGAPLPRIC